MFFSAGKVRVSTGEGAQQGDVGSPKQSYSIERTHSAPLAQPQPRGNHATAERYYIERTMKEVRTNASEASLKGVVTRANPGFDFFAAFLAVGGAVGVSFAIAPVVFGLLKLVICVVAFVIVYALMKGHTGSGEGK